MKRILSLIVFLAIFHALPAFSQGSSAENIVLGTLTTTAASPIYPIWVPISSANPLNISTTGGGGGGGTVTSVSVATANGFSGTVANATTTPAITIIAGAINPTSIGATTSGAGTFSSALLGTTTFSSGINATSLSSGTVVASSYLGLNSSNQVVLGAGGAGAAFTPVLQPLSLTTTDTAGNLFPYSYIGTGGNVSPVSPSWGVAASLGADVVLQGRFLMPPTLPASGTLNLCSLAQANATSGVVEYTISDADVALNNSADPSAASLTGETQTSITWSHASDYVETCTPLSETPTARHVSVVAITFNHTSWTLAQIFSANWYEEWR